MMMPTHYESEFKEIQIDEYFYYLSNIDGNRKSEEIG